MVVVATGLLLGIAAFAHGADGTSTHAVRNVKGRTIFSKYAVTTCLDPSHAKRPDGEHATAHLSSLLATRMPNPLLR